MAQITLERLQKAYATVAKLVVDDAVYLPIFLRLEAEIAAFDGDVINRAKAVAALHKATG